MKQCRRCFEWKERQEFYRKKSNADGKSTLCKVCERDDAREHRAKKKKEREQCQQISKAS